MIASFIALASLVPAQPYVWQNVAIVGGGFVTGVITHPKAKDVVYARTDIGGAYRLDPKTRKWVPIEDWITKDDWNLYGAESIALDPNDPNRVYIAAGTYVNWWAGYGAILRSKDRGRTWALTDMPFKMGGNQDGRSIGERLDVDPNDGNVIFFGSRQAGLWRSSDAGVHWRRIESFPIKPNREGEGVGWLVFDPRGGHLGSPTQTIYAGAIEKGTTLWKSTDAGATWSPVPGQPNGFYPHHARLAPNGVLYVAYCDAFGPNGVSDGAVWKLNTATGVWTEITPEKPGPGNGFGYGGLCLDAEHPGTIMVSTLCRWARVDTVFRSTDDGAHWVSLKDKAVRDTALAPYLKWGDPVVKFGHWIGDVEIDPFDSNRAWYITGEGLWTTDDLTAADRNLPTHWYPGSQGLEETAINDLASPTEGAPLVSAMGDISGFRHDDLLHSPPGGMSRYPMWSTTQALDFAGLRPSLFIRVGNNGSQSGALSQDGAASWTPFATNPPGTRGGGSAGISADGSSIVWSPSGAAPCVSFDNGKTWTACLGVPASGRVVSDKVDPKAFYMQEEGSPTIFVSHDGGLSFAKGASVDSHNAGPLVAVFNRAGDLWLPTPDGLYHSTDGGQTLNKLDSSVHSAERVGFGKAAPGADYPAIYLIGEVHDEQAIFRSTDEGITWVRINDANTAFGSKNDIIGDPKLFGILFGDPAPTGVRKDN
jgi:photosystem II stability/assembly factor-like uncharacterized protein